MPVTKKYLAKVYDQDGTTLQKTLIFERTGDGSSHLKNEPTFHTRINGGQGELILDLKAPFDDFDEGASVTFMNVVKLYSIVTDDVLKTQTSTLIYTGYVSRYEPYVESGGVEGVRVTCLGLVSLLTKSYYSDGDFTVPRGPEDPTVTGKAIITHFNTVFSGSLLSYDSSSVPAAVGTSITYTFTDQKWFDCLKKVGELAGTGWWWSVENGTYSFKAKPSSPTHTFVIGKDVESLSCPKDSEGVINDVYLRRSGGTETTYADATSQSTFGTGSPATGKFSEILSDTSIQNATTADQRGNKEVADKKDEKVKATLVVNSNYTLESIHVGETCKVTHFRRANTFFGASPNMLIVGVTYTPDRCALELEGSTSDFGLALAGFVG